ncbi:TraU family protein, partial [Pseudomonas sp. MPR-AND1A]
ADVTMKPWCFPNLGGIRIAPGFDIGQGYLTGPSMVGGRSQSTAKWHVHWYVYPLLYWMEILTDFACFEQASFDIAYM